VAPRARAKPRAAAEGRERTRPPDNASAQRINKNRCIVGLHSIWQDIVDQEPPIDSVVDFPTRSRFHIALNVKDVEPMLPFYSVLLGAEPTLVRDGYAKYEMKEPPMHISLNRVAHNAKGNGRFGIEVRQLGFVEAAFQRAAGSTFAPHVRRTGGGGQAFAATDPENNRWTIAEAEPAPAVQQGSLRRLAS
jgi:catechol 2,3-dioxygenase-like lactoylglutathione lyase family enzyme